MAKDLLISFAVGILVGLLYGVIKVKSPAPPVIAYWDSLEWCWASRLVVGFIPGRWMWPMPHQLVLLASIGISVAQWQSRFPLRVERSEKML
jgi:xanthosine utilization system XapX-like protein